MDIEQIEAEIMKLEPEARAELARRILENLDAPSEAEALRLWVAEAERRLADLRQGNAAEAPADEVLRRVRDRIA
jgi:putative addiction module component (TIGR02574 family)